MQQGLAAEKIHLADVTLAQDVQCTTKLICIYPAQLANPMFAVSKITKVAPSIAGIRYGDIAESRTAAANEFQNIDCF
jgi:hypothetical protein